MDEDGVIHRVIPNFQIKNKARKGKYKVNLTEL